MFLLFYFFSPMYLVYFDYLYVCVLSVAYMKHHGSLD